MAERDELSPIASAVGDFVQLESAAGILLLAAAALAALVANSPLASFYDALLETTVAVQVGTSSINKPLPLWINAGHMAIFSMLVGLEIKREIMEGELRSPPRSSCRAWGRSAGCSSRRPSTPE